MNFFARVFLLLLVVSQTACANLPSMAEATARAAANPEERDYDSRYVRWVDGAAGSVWARLRTFNPESALTKSLLRACAQGKNVEVVVWAGYESQVQHMPRSCLRVWSTNHPDVAKLPDTLLIDSEKLVIYGNLEDLGGKRARNEYFAQAQVKNGYGRFLN